MDNMIIQAIGSCNPDEPLGQGDIRWQNFDEVRKTSLHARIAKRLRGAEAAGQYSHIALAGHRGCGKSTELMRVIEETRHNGYLPLYAVANKMVDPNDIGFGDIFILMLRLLQEEFEIDKSLRPLSEKTVEQVSNWFRQVTKVEEQEIERAIAYHGETQLGFDTPFAKLLSGLTALRKSTGRRKQEIKESIEEYPEQLRRNLNLVISEAKSISQKVYPRGILFILDNLDRYPPDMINAAILRNADLFQGIESHVIFVVPISMMYIPPEDMVEDRYESETLPMVPVYPRGNPKLEEKVALNALVEAVFRRVDKSLFTDVALARQLAKLSGGCPRDLFRLLKEALLESEEVINDHAVCQAANRVRSEMSRKHTLADYEVLARVHLDGTIDKDETGRNLLYRRAALEYDVTVWVGVHPLLWDTFEFQAALDAERKRRGYPG